MRAIDHLLHINLAILFYLDWPPREDKMEMSFKIIKTKKIKTKKIRVQRTTYLCDVSVRLFLRIFQMVSDDPRDAFSEMVQLGLKFNWD